MELLRVKKQLQSIWFIWLSDYTGLDGAGQIAALCKYAADNGYTIRAVGTGSSWSRLTHTRDILVVMTDLIKILADPVAISEDSQDSEMESTEIKFEVEVQAGKRVVEFVEELDKKHNVALKMIGNYAGQTVGGVTVSCSLKFINDDYQSVSITKVSLHEFSKGGACLKLIH